VNTYDVVRGLHILAVIAWMAGMLFLPRLFAYDAEQNAKAEPLKSEMQGLLRVWQTRLLRIIINPAMILAFIFGAWLFWLRSGEGADWSFAHQPWMVTMASWPGNAGRSPPGPRSIPASSGA
jgi:putative membrane protein